MSRVLSTRSGLLASFFFFRLLHEFCVRAQRAPMFFFFFFICINFENAIKCSLSSEAKKAPGCVHSRWFPLLGQTKVLPCAKRSLSEDAESSASFPPPPLWYMLCPVCSHECTQTSHLTLSMFCVCVRAEIAWKWALKQTVDGSQKEIHGNRVAPSGIWR